MISVFSIGYSIFYVSILLFVTLVQYVGFMSNIFWFCMFFKVLSDILGLCIMLLELCIVLSGLCRVCQGFAQCFWGFVQSVGALYSLVRCPHPNLSPPGPSAGAPPPPPEQQQISNQQKYLISNIKHMIHELKRCCR